MKYTNYLPRNEYQLCELFEDLLFMRSEKFMSEDDQRESEEYKLRKMGSTLFLTKSRALR